MAKPALAKTMSATWMPTLQLLELHRLTLRAAATGDEPPMICATMSSTAETGTSSVPYILILMRCSIDEVQEHERPRERA